MCAGVCAFPGAGFSLPSGPEELVARLARAVKEKDVQGFRELVDVSALLDADEALLYAEKGNLMPHYFKQQETEQLLEGIASGVLALQCKDAVRPGCPWYPRGLEWAKMVKKTAETAIAAVDSEKDIRTWLVLCKEPSGWRVIAAPVRLGEAEAYAAAGFRDSLARYQADITAKLRKEHEEQETAKGREKEEKERVLGSVPVSDLSFAMEDEDALLIQGIAVNGNERETDLCGLAVHLTDSLGQPRATYQYKMNGLRLMGGQKDSFLIKARLGTDKALAGHARQLIKGELNARGETTCVRYDGGRYIQR